MRLLVMVAVAAVVVASAVATEESKVTYDRPLPVRSRSRSIIPQLNFRSRVQNISTNSRPNFEEHKEIPNEEIGQEIEVITKPKPGEEYVSFLKGNLNTNQKPKSEVLLITEPMPGQEFVSFGVPNSDVKDSVVSARDGEVFYINIDKRSYDGVDIVDDTIIEPIPLPVSEPTVSEQFTANKRAIDFVTVIPDQINYDDSNTETPYTGLGFNNNIEILTPNSKGSLSGTAVNELYGKYFDESDLAFGNGQNEEDKTLFPAESNVRSKFEIKEVNGQLYEYEYRYYYDEEVPEYDYDVVGNIPDLPGSANATVAEPLPSLVPASTTTTTTTTSTTTTTPAPVRGSSRSRTRSRGSAGFTSPVQENAIIPQTSRTRSRGQVQNTIRSQNRDANVQPIRTSSRGNTNLLIDNIVKDNNIVEAQLPTQTRFPPRVTTPAPKPRSFGIPLITAIPEEASILQSFINQDISTTVNPIDEFTTVMSPATRSLVNLYALSQAAGAEDTEISTISNAAVELETIVPYDYLDAYYDYDYTTENNTFVSQSITESSTNSDYLDFTTVSPTTTTTTTTTTTPKPTTTTTTTAAPTPQSRTRGSLRSNFRGRNRFSSRSSSPAPITEGTTESPTTTTTTTVKAPGRASNRFSSGSSLSRSSNRFKPFSRTFSRTNAAKTSPPSDDSSTTKATVSSATTEESVTTTVKKEENPRRTNRFSRPRPSFSRKSKTVTTTAKPTPKPKTSGLRSRGRLFAGRLNRNKQVKEVVNVTESVIVGEDNVQTPDEVSIDVEISSIEPSTTLAPATTTKATRRRGGFGRGRLNRGGIRNTRLQVTTQTPEEVSVAVVDVSESTAIVNAEENKIDVILEATTPSPRRGSRRGSSRLSARFNSRGRGKSQSTTTTSTTTETAVEEEVVAEIVGDVQVDVPETPIEEVKEKTPAEQSGRKQSSRRVGAFGRFRNSARTKADTTDKTAQKAPATAAPGRRSSLLSNRRRRPSVSRNRGKVEVEVEEEVVEEEVPAAELETVAAPEEPIPQVDEIVHSEPEAQGPQVELEAQGSEDLVSVVEQEAPMTVVAAPDDVKITKPTGEGKKTGKSKRPQRVSLLAMLRNRQRGARS